MSKVPDRLRIIKIIYLSDKTNKVQRVLLRALSRAVAVFLLCLGGGGGSAVPQKAVKEIFSGLLGGTGGMLPRKIFKIKDPRLARNAFPKISAWKN